MLRINDKYFKSIQFVLEINFISIYDCCLLTRSVSECTLCNSNILNNKLFLRYFNCSNKYSQSNTIL